jgi:hypothetical protein
MCKSLLCWSLTQPRECGNNHDTHLVHINLRQTTLKAYLDGLIWSNRLVGDVEWIHLHLKKKEEDCKAPPTKPNLSKHSFDHLAAFGIEALESPTTRHIVCSVSTASMENRKNDFDRFQLGLVWGLAMEGKYQ